MRKFALLRAQIWRYFFLFTRGLLLGRAIIFGVSLQCGSIKIQRAAAVLCLNSSKIAAESISRRVNSAQRGVCSVYNPLALLSRSRFR